MVSETVVWRVNAFTAGFLTLVPCDTNK